MQYNRLRTFRKGFMTLDSPEATSVERKTYKNPVAKMVITNIFCFSGIRSFQTQGIGSIKMAKSEMTLKIPVA